MNAPNPQGAVLVGNDALNKLIDIYMDGLCTGAASAALTIAGASNEQADAFSDATCAAIRADPLAIEAIRREITERLAGVDSGPWNFTVPLDGGAK